MKSCINCLHCKVSALSKRNLRLCFCAEAEETEIHRDTYWITKPVCEKFEDMREQPASVLIIQAVAVKRCPLLRERYEQ